VIDIATARTAGPPRYRVDISGVACAAGNGVERNLALHRPIRDAVPGEPVDSGDRLTGLPMRRTRRRPDLRGGGDDHDVVLGRRAPFGSLSTHLETARILGDHSLDSRGLLQAVVGIAPARGADSRDALGVVALGPVDGDAPHPVILLAGEPRTGARLGP
jgi:hypothetical protein